MIQRMRYYVTLLCYMNFGTNTFNMNHIKAIFLAVKHIKTNKIMCGFTKKP